MKKIEEIKGKKGKNLTRWHRLLAKMLEVLLTPVDITVTPDFPIMSNPPEADILLIRRDHARWTREQLMRLPDGIRDTRADHILIEFKYTESVNKSVLAQALAYDTFYRRIQESLKQERIQTFVVSSKTPRKHFFEKFGYTEQEKQGIYKSRHSMLDSLTILSLNDLADEPHNQFIKCFASRKKEKKLAFNNIFQSSIYLLHSPLQWFITGLWRTCFNTGGNVMELGLTPEEIMEVGKSWEESYLNSLSVEKRLAGLRPEEILKIGKSWEESYLNSLSVEKRLAGLRPEDRLAGLRPEDRLAGLRPEEVLGKLSIKDIEKYIEKLKKQNLTK